MLVMPADHRLAVVARHNLGGTPASRANSLEMNTVRQRASTMSPDSPALSIARANSRSSGCSGSGELAEPSDIAVGYPALPVSDREISKHPGKLPMDGVWGGERNGNTTALP